MSENMKTWTVVTFQIDNSVEAIPTTWLTGPDTCVFPDFTSERNNKAIRNYEELNTCWPTYKIRRFRNATYDDYATARLKSKKAENESDLNASATEHESRKRRQPRRLLYSSSDDDGSDNREMTILKTPPKLKKKISANANTSSALKAVPRKPLQTVENVEMVLPAMVSTPASVSGVALPLNRRKVMCNFCGNEDILQEILQEQFLTKKILLDFIKEVRETKQENTKEPSNPNLSIHKLFHLPISAEEAFEEFNNFLKSPENFENAAKEISLIGGRNSYDFIKRSLQLLITNKLASRYSWLGRRLKKAFCGLPIARLITEASMKSNKGSTLKEVELNIISWLRRAGDRVKLATNKKIRTGPSEEPDDVDETV